MEYNDNKNFILNCKMINQDLGDEVIILDDDDFIQTTFSLFSTNELSQQKEQINNVSLTENLLQPSCDFIDLTSNDDFDLYDIFMLNQDQNYNLTSQFNENEITLSVKPELESKKLTSFQAIPQACLKYGEISILDYMSPPDNSIENLTEKNKRFTCSECIKTFDKSYNYKRHLLLHQIKNNESSSFDFESNHCPNCNKQIADRSNFIKHLKICSPHSLENFRSKKKMKSANLNQFSCPICEKIFSKKSNLNRHLGVHFMNELNRNNDLSINVTERPVNGPVSIHLYECENCLRRFSNKQLLNNHKHRLTHLNKAKCNQWDKINNLSDVNTDGSDCSFNAMKNIQCLYCGTCTPNIRCYFQFKIIYGQYKFEAKTFLNAQLNHLFFKKNYNFITINLIREYLNRD
ncbi:gastrula zinc finger -like [Brachionus plicatilis]|uniref:Gastrula zinc finger-like n=1 Tax=Brachionus plicatilis TaxID=10195 RepID=A0A3M7RRH2_BRAPC|nr:gastrula zinc finger -like [Brachionus plicatilis]